MRGKRTRKHIACIGRIASLLANEVGEKYDHLTSKGMLGAHVLECMNELLRLMVGR